MMRAHHLILGYRGTLNNELITSILQLTESKLKEMQLPFRKKKAIVNILIECLQNTLYHSEHTEEDRKHGNHCIFLLGKRDGHFFIQIGNYVSTENVVHLKAKLDYMGTLQADEIHKLYMEVLDKGHISEKGGAGLGILRVMKDSGGNVKYDFFTVEAGRSFFSMEVQVNE